MFTFALVASFFATLSLASHVGRQQSACPSNGVKNASNFTLLAVVKSDTKIQKPLAIKLPSIPETTWLAVFIPSFIQSDRGNELCTDAERWIY